MTNDSLMVKRVAECSKGSILQYFRPSIIKLSSTFIKLPFVIKIIVLSIFEWPLKTGFTVCVTNVSTALSPLTSHFIRCLVLFQPRMSSRHNWGVKPQHNQTNEHNVPFPCVLVYFGIERNRKYQGIFPQPRHKHRHMVCNLVHVSLHYVRCIFAF